MPSYKFYKGERLKSKKKINEIFTDGKTMSSFPILCYYLFTDTPYSKYTAQAGFAVSKKNFKRAVDRNAIKRKMREAYRLHKDEYLGSVRVEKKRQLMMMFIYTGKDIPQYRTVEKSIKKIINRMRNRL